MLIRLEALELAANTGDAAASRFGLNAIQVRADGSVIATDGTQILRIRAAALEPGLFDALLPEEERVFEGDLLVDATDARDFKAACKKALKAAGKKSVGDGGEPFHVVVAKVDESLTLASQDGIIERRFVIKQKDERKFPDIERVLPSGEKREIVLSVDLLLKILRTLKRLRVGAVTFGLTDDPNKSIAISADSTAGKIDGALMPMRSQEDKPEKVDPIVIDAGTGEILDGPIHAVTQ